MSSERTDYVAEARANLGTIGDVIQATERVSLAETIAVTHVQATLALVEQQRISNLIAVAKWNSRALVEGARRVGDDPLDFEAEVARVDGIFAEVQKGLGI